MSRHLMDPLATPDDHSIREQFCSFFRLPTDGEPRRRLTSLTQAFSLIPYENLTKIIKYAQCGSPAAARRHPAEVLRDFYRSRTGGTCFSLTAALLYLVRSLELRAEPILADRRYGDDTHCALLVWLDDRPHLLDPGYLIVDPIPLDTTVSELTVTTRFNQLHLVPEASDRLELHTSEQGRRRYRLTFKLLPANATQFQLAWEASFGWEMMHYCVLALVTKDQQLYLRDGRLQRRSLAEVQREEIPAAQLADRITHDFGIQIEVVQQALRILRRAE